MARDISSIKVVFKALLERGPWRDDYNVIEMPWRLNKETAITRRVGTPGLSTGRLVFGMMACDGNVRPHPHIRRAMALVRQVLEQCGHEVRAIVL